MSRFERVAKSEEIGEGEVIAFEVSGQKVAVAHVGEAFYAFGDLCTHARCSLAEGELEGTTIACVCHGSRFDVTSGEVLNPPADEPVPVFPVRVEGDEIQVDVG